MYLELDDDEKLIPIPTRCRILDRMLSIKKNSPKADDTLEESEPEFRTTWVSLFVKADKSNVQGF